MERVDYNTNRLPRGRRYACNGSVREIDVEGNTVRALVQGTRRKPYDVSIRVKPFSRAQASKVKLLLSANPALASALSLGKLPERMLDMLEDAGVHLFPRSWKDLEADCSCPDWANPCKHLAAVYYLLANEIDKDPFLVFELRGVPSASLREAADMADTAETTGTVSGDGGETASRDVPAFVPYRDHSAEEINSIPRGWVDLDLSFPRLDLDAVFSLLEGAPLFWEGGDFKKTLRGAYRAVAAAAEEPEVMEDFPSLRGMDFYLLLEGDAPSFFLALDGDGSPHPARVTRMLSAVARDGPPPKPAQRKLPVRKEGGGLELATRKGLRLEAGPVLDLFLSLPLETDLGRYSPSSRALCVAGAIALALARSHLYVPDLVPLAPEGEAREWTPGGFRVRYVPLITEEKVKPALEALESLLPRELAFRRKGHAVPAPGYARHLVALFLDHVVRRHAGMPGGYGSDKLLRAFFAGEPYRPRGFAERRTMSAVANWLERLYIRGKAVSPVVRVELIEGSHGAGIAGEPLGAGAAEEPLGSGIGETSSVARTAGGQLGARAAEEPLGSGIGETSHGPGLARGRYDSGTADVPHGSGVEQGPHGLGVADVPDGPGVADEPLDDVLFGLHLDVEDREDPMAPMLSLAEVFAAEDEVFSRPAAPLKRDLARQIAVAGEYLPPLSDILNSRGVMGAVVGPAEMAELLTRHAAVLEVLGIRLVLPRELARLLSPRLALRASFPGPSKAVKHLSLDQMLDFDWVVSIGDAALSREEFLALARSAGGVVRFREGYVLLTPAEAGRLLERMSKPPPQPEPAEFLHWLLAGERDGVELRADKALERWLKKLTRPEEAEIPSGLAGELRPYQERGYRWLYTNALRGLGSCLADDMGLGKTIQAIALVLALRERGVIREAGKGGKAGNGRKRKNADAEGGGRPHLVVCPTSVVGNWHKEVERFAPSLRASVYHGAERRLRTKGVDLVITTYGTLRRDLEKFKARRWGALIIDEAQNIKNPATAQARAVKALKAECRVALSGTPVENHLGELWSIFDYLNPGYLGSLESFRKTYAAPIEKYRDGERIERLRRVTAPFVMRRLKSDKSIISDLPDKITAEEYCYLTPEQAALYQRVVDEVMELIESSQGMRRRGNILKLITSLKQVCDHPALFAKRGKVEARLSGKASRCISLLENVLAAGEKALVFTQYVEMGEILLQMIEAELGERPLFFHGGVPRRARDEMARAFQEDGGHPIMVVSLRAGGTGLNLTAASNVIHYDLWWNPAVEEQATDRTYRIGQERNVYVHRLITLNTFEEKIDEMMRDKRELAELTVSAGERFITELSNRELKELFALRE